MKILILSNNTGGLYSFRTELISELAKEHTVILSSPIGDELEALTALGCTFVETHLNRRGMNPLKDLALLKEYKALIKREKPDLVITYTIKPNIYGGYACAKYHVPHAANITGLGTAFQNTGMLRKLVSIMYKIGLKHSKVVFFENSGNLDTLVSEGIVKKSQTKLLSGAGVNLERFLPAKYPESDETRFLYIGRIMQEKGLDELFGAMKRLISDGEKCSLDVLGYYEDNYEEVIKEYQKAGWLHYYGYQNDVKPFITNAHCFVLPSWHEGMANTNLECASMCRPVITSNIPGCKEAVIDGVSGYLCEKKNADSLYLAMKKLISLSNSEREKMGLAGRKHMEEVFDKKVVVKETIEALMR